MTNCWACAGSGLEASMYVGEGIQDCEVCDGTGKLEKRNTMKENHMKDKLETVLDNLANGRVIPAVQESVINTIYKKIDEELDKSYNKGFSEALIRDLDLGDWADSTANKIIESAKDAKEKPLTSTIALALRAAYANGFEDAKDRAETICQDLREMGEPDMRSAIYGIRSLKAQENK